MELLMLLELISPERYQGDAADNNSLQSHTAAAAAAGAADLCGSSSSGSPELPDVLAKPHEAAAATAEAEVS
jgi:hypothetical protein